MASEQARIAMMANTAIGTCITGTLFFIGLVSIFENRHKLQLSSAHTRWRVSLFSAAFFAFLVFLLDGMLVWKSWTGNDYGCQAITIPHVLTYFAEKQCMNLFLYDRAKIVHESLRIQGTKLKYLSWFRMLLWLTLVIGIPITFYWSAFVAFTGVVYPETNCVFYVLFPVVPILFAISDAILATGMLLIFLIPLISHARGIGITENGNVKGRISKVINRNILFSSIALASGFCGLVTLSILEWVANDDGTNNTRHLRIWASFTIAFDNFIGVTAIHCMTFGWLPFIIQRRLKLVSEKSSTMANSNPRPAKKSKNNQIASTDNGEMTNGTTNKDKSFQAMTIKLEDDAEPTSSSVNY